LIKPQRFIFLDGMRGIAALAVVFLHFTLHSGHRVFFQSANLAVDLFFCLSGFVIAYSYYAKLASGASITEYFKKRLIRLYPMFLIGILLGIVAICIKSNLSQTDFTTRQILSASILNALYLPYFNDASITMFNEELKGSLFPINGPSWSLFFELVANFAFVFTVRLSKPALLILTAILGAWLVYSGIHFNTSPGWSTFNFIGGFPRVGFSFMVGVLIFKYFDSTANLPKIHWLVISAILAAMLLFPRGEHWIYYWAICTVAVIPAIVTFGARASVSGSIANKTLTYLGEMSYPVYCVHTPILLLISCLKFSLLPWSIFFLCSFGLIVTATHFSARYIDEPFRKHLSERYIRKPVKPDSATA